MKDHKVIEQKNKQTKVCDPRFKSYKLEVDCLCGWGWGGVGVINGCMS